MLHPSDIKPKGRQYTLNAHAREVEERLRTLQEASRLAIHVFENEDVDRYVPQKILTDMRTTGKLLHSGTARSIEKDEAPLVSASLIPSLKSGKAIEPFQIAYGSEPGYLLNLDPSQHVPPVIVRAMETITLTGNNNFDKRFQLFHDRVHPHFASLYSHYTHDRSDPIDDCGSGFYTLSPAERMREKALLNDALRNSLHFNTALDILGFLYENTRHKRTSELLVAMSPEHIAAIVNPVSASVFKAPIDRAFNDLQTLYATLVAHEHIKHGMDLPLVNYKTKGRSAGEIHYLAQGEDELRALAEKSITAIKSNPEFENGTPALLHRLGYYTAPIWDWLKLDITEPLPPKHSVSHVRQ